MKIQLVYPPMIDNFTELARTASYPPLGLLSIASYIRKQHKDIKIEILDGQVKSLKEICSKLDADFIGISTTILTSELVLQIASIAKETGAKVILGGSHASSVANELLRKRSFIDAIVIGDGEEAFYNYISGINPQNIPNLYYRKNGKLYKNFVSSITLDKLPILDLSLVNFKEYSKSFQKRYARDGFKCAVAISSQRGCLWQERTGGCVFCRHLDTKWSTKCPELVWKEISYFCSNYGVDYVWDVSDSFLTDLNWVFNFAHAKPPEINPAFLLFARANEITPHSLKLLKKINCHKIIIGLESGSSKCLKLSRKGIGIQTSKKATELLSENNIEIMPSLIIGLPGEDSKTLKSTAKFAEYLVKKYNVYEIGISIAIPVPGSPMFKMMMQREDLRNKYLGKDIFDLDELRNDWVKNFCSVNLNELREIEKLIAEMAEIRTGFALDVFESKKNEEKN